ncbi:hypothetical protein G6L12_05820 [Agrobacterium rhizogenes]|nr:hypothetical protein [Rhizobium rhizogenes]NTF73992.1 hypothetical protein [Rhizobium rhizogenes]
MGGLFGSKTPSPTPATPMPDTEDPAVKEAQRRAAAATQARSGRSATVLTTRQQRAASSPAGQPGTQAYSNSLLGQAS